MKIVVTLTAAALAALTALQAKTIVRDEQIVHVGSTRERWQLVWQTHPQVACGPRDEGWARCPCSGFAFGEMGQLDLVRKVPGHSDDTLHLSPFFADGENPAAERSKQDAVLQRWAVLRADYEHHFDDTTTAFERSVEKRPSVKVLELADYDHDGRATEFMLQIGVTPCSHSDNIVVGISRNQPTLHAIKSVAHPERPLILERHIWNEFLRSRGRITSVEWRCGDHASEQELVVRLIASDKGIDATRLVYGCTAAGKRGALQSTEKF